MDKPNSKKRPAEDMEGTPHMMVVSVGGKVLSQGMQVFSVPAEQCQQLPVISTVPSIETSSGVTVQLDTTTSDTLQGGHTEVPLIRGVDGSLEGQDDHNYGSETNTSTSADHVAWTDEAVFYLCERVRFHHSELSKCGGTKFTMRNILEAVFEDMKERNMNFSSTQVETKWYTLNTVYMRNLKKMMNKETVRWKFFDVMHDLVHTVSKSKPQKPSLQCSQTLLTKRDPNFQGNLLEEERYSRVDKLIASREQYMKKIDDQFLLSQEIERAKFENDKKLRAEVSQLTQEVSVLKKICVEQLKVQKNTEKLIERIGKALESLAGKHLK